MRQPGHAPNCKCEDCEGQTGIEEIEWIKLGELRPGAIFETMGFVRAMKTEYHTFNNGRTCDCYLLESGEAAHFPDGDNELVRELKL